MIGYHRSQAEVIHQLSKADPSKLPVIVVRYIKDGMEGGASDRT
jgi:hypothetical protein